MLFSPVPLGKQTIPPDELRRDASVCRKIGPCGLGKRAVYLNSFFVDRRYYLTYTEISRVFKRVAMSKGGFTGKGMFGSIPYLVVLTKGGREQKCNFKYEEQVDQFIRLLHESHPEIPTVSAEAEKRLAAGRAREEALYVKDLTSEAESALAQIRETRSFLEKSSPIPEQLSHAAKQKRVMDQMNPTYRYTAVVVFLIALASLVFGLVSVFRHQGYAMYLLLFGMAFLFYTMSSQILPTGRNNKKYADRCWQEALQQSRQNNQNCPGYVLPAQYAHPAACDRMIRIIRQGRAQSADQAWTVMKDELKKLNAEVTVSQIEYDEITAVKPMFLICNYQDEI